MVLFVKYKEGLSSASDKLALGVYCEKLQSRLSFSFCRVAKENYILKMV